MDYLVTHGADVTKIDKEGRTPIDIAHINKDLNILVPLCEYFNVSLEKYGFSSLNQAVFSGDFKKVKQALQEGADVNKADIRGITPLIMAADRSSNLSIVEYLLNHDADVNKTDDYGRTPLYFASQHGCFPIVKYFVDHGADVNKANKDDQTPLHIAFFLPNYDYSEGSYQTLGMKFSENDFEIVKYLVNHGADVNKADSGGITPLHLAVNTENLELVEFLVYSFQFANTYSIASNKLSNFQDKSPIFRFK